MVWIKRNLFWVVFGLATLVLLGGGGYYLYTGIERNAEADKKLDELKDRWQKLQARDPYPNDANIATARKSVQDLNAFIASAKKLFPPIPYTNVTGIEFKRVLDLAISDLQKKALQAGVQLPYTNYAFSFDAQKTKAQFAAGSMPLLPELLSEVTVVCSELFQAKINRILDLKRPTTADDQTSSGSSCHRLPREVNHDLGYVMSPYELSFLTFSSELADVLQHFATAPNCLIVKALVVEPDPSRGPGGVLPPSLNPPPNAPGGQPSTGPPTPGPPRRIGRSPPPAGGMPVRPGRGTPGVAGGSGEMLSTVINEQLFRVTCLVMVVKPVK